MAQSTIDSMSAAIPAVAAAITNLMESGASADNSVVAKGTASNSMILLRRRPILLMWCARLEILLRRRPILLMWREQLVILLRWRPIPLRWRA